MRWLENQTAIAACVGGGSNAMGIFSAFIEDSVDLYAIEPAGKGSKLVNIGYYLWKRGVMHGFNSIMLIDENGEPVPVHSIASGIDYPSVGPEHAYLNSIGRTKVGPDKWWRGCWSILYTFKMWRIIQRKHLLNLSCCFFCYEMAKESGKINFGKSSGRGIRI